MNIFVLDTDPEKCAQYHNDKHVVKMILEHAQMLSTAVRLSGIEAGYKSAYVNHPCTIWARESLNNWLWLKLLTYHLHEEWRFRFKHNKIHKSWNVITNLPKPKIEMKGITPFVMAMPDEFKQKDVIEAYRNYYMFEKEHLASWTNRGKPYWWKD